jgi:RNA polymerase sigma-70 factor, ECF subfamily
MIEPRNYPVTKQIFNSANHPVSNSLNRRHNYRMKPEESRLLDGARCFDPEALAEIYDAYSSVLFAYAIRLLGDNSQAEECVADTFYRFLQALRSGVGPDHYLQAYLYRIAHNWITDRYRRQPPPTIELDEKIADASQTDPSWLAGDRIQQQQVRAALVRLTPEQRQVLVLKFWEGLDNEQISHTIQKPISAVKALQHRAINALRRIMLPSKEVIE